MSDTCSIRRLKKLADEFNAKYEPSNTIMMFEKYTPEVLQLFLSQASQRIEFQARRSEYIFTKCSMIIGSCLIGLGIVGWLWTQGIGSTDCAGQNTVLLKVLLLLPAILFTLSSVLASSFASYKSYNTPNLEDVVGLLGPKEINTLETAISRALYLSLRCQWINMKAINNVMRKVNLVIRIFLAGLIFMAAGSVVILLL